MQNILTILIHHLYTGLTAKQTKENNYFILCLYFVTFVNKSLRAEDHLGVSHIM